MNMAEGDRIHDLHLDGRPAQRDLLAVGRVDGRTKKVWLGSDISWVGVSMNHPRLLPSIQLLQLVLLVLLAGRRRESSLSPLHFRHL